MPSPTRPLPARPLTLRLTELESRTTPALALPRTFAAGEDTLANAAVIDDDPTGTRHRTGDPSLNSPFVSLYAADGTSQALSPVGRDFTGGARVARADFTGDGVDELAVGSGPGTAPLVRVFSLVPVTPGPGQSDTLRLQILFETTPFEASFTGGVYVAAGDLTGDGRADLVVTPDEGGGPRARVLNGDGFTPVLDFFGIEDPNFRGGARAAVGDVTGDGRGDLVVAAGFGGGPRVAVWDGSARAGGALTRKPVADFFVFEDTLRNGVYLTSGDVNGDGFDDVVAGGGPGGGPRVLALSGRDLVQAAGRQTVLANFFAGDPSLRGGVRLAAKDLDGDARADLVTGVGPGAPEELQRRVTTYAGALLTPGLPPPPLDTLDAGLSFGFADGVFVG